MNDVFDIVVDAQGDFMRTDGKLYVPGAEGIVDALGEHVAHLDSVGVLFTYDTHPEDEALYYASAEGKEFPYHCGKGTSGWQLVVDPCTSPVPFYTMEKGVFDMWAENGLFVKSQPDFTSIGGGVMTSCSRGDFFMDLVTKGIRKIRITGVAADYCVKLAVDGLIARGFEVKIVKALTVGIKRGIEQVVREDWAGKTVTCV